MTQEERYRKVFEERRMREADEFNAKGEGVRDYSGPLAEGVGRDKIDASVKAGQTDLQNNAITSEAESAKSPYGAAAQSAVSTMNQGGSTAATLGSGMTTAGALMMAGSKPSPASPYLLGAGLGLSVLAQGEANRRQQEEAQRQAYNERIRDRQEKMAMIASMGIK